MWIANAVIKTILLFSFFNFSLLNMIEHPLTQYQDGYSSLLNDSYSNGAPNLYKCELYGNVGHYSGSSSVAACVLIVCRMVWPIFVYQPLGHPGVLVESSQLPKGMESKPGLDLYCPAEKEVLTTEPLIRFDLASESWIVVITDDVRSVFDARRVGFIESGIEALKWLRKKSTHEFKRLLSTVSGYNHV